MKESNSRREFLSQSGKMVTAAALFGTSVPLAHAAVAGTLNCEANNTMKITDPHYYLDNVLLETGFDYENGVAVQTRTARQTVEIQDGKIVALRENKLHPDATLPHYDAGGKLMLPTTRDMHIHLDKTFYGGPAAGRRRFHTQSPPDVAPAPPANFADFSGRKPVRYCSGCGQWWCLSTAINQSVFLPAPECTVAVPAAFSARV